MIDLLRTLGRVLWMHWPAMLAWYLAGTLGWYLSIELAGFVGAYSSVGGTLLLPVAILCRLIAFVAMLLVARDGMRELRVVAPLPEDGAARRSAFLDGLLAGILPFFAFYAAWGFLQDDASAYFTRVLEVNLGLEEAVSDGEVGWLSVGPVSIVLLIVAFTARWLLGRYRARLPKAVGILAAYLEALWIYLSLVVIKDVLDGIGGWVQQRQAMVWLGDIRETIAQGFAPLAFVWEGIEWLIGEAGGIILLPVAWLVIAGVVYGQAVAPERLKIRVALLDGVQDRYRSIPARLRRRLGDVWASVTARFRPIWSALLLMWRAGPMLIASYVLFYAVVVAMERLLGLAATRIVGPHEEAFWFANMELITLAVPLIIEPLRVSLVAGAYDSVVGRLVSGRTRATEAAASAEAPTDPPADAPVPASLRRNRPRP